MRPAHLPIIRDLDLPSLPSNVTVDKIFADHFGYVRQQVKDYITATYGDGGNIWTSLSPSMYVILTTPNGWEGGMLSFPFPNSTSNDEVYSSAESYAPGCHPGWLSR